MNGQESSVLGFSCWKPVGISQSLAVRDSSFGHGRYQVVVITLYMFVESQGIMVISATREKPRNNLAIRLSC